MTVSVTAAVTVLSTISGTCDYYNYKSCLIEPLHVLSKKNYGLILEATNDVTVAQLVQKNCLLIETKQVFFAFVFLV